MSPKEAVHRSKNLAHIADQIRLFDDAWEKLAYLNWSRDSLASLLLATRNIARIARSNHDPGLIELSSKLEEQINSLLAREQLPDGAEQMRLRAIIEELRRAVNPTSPETGQPARADALHNLPSGEVAILDAGDSQYLIEKLQSAGFQVNHINNLSDAQAYLAQNTPLALIVDVDFSGTSLAGIELITLARIDADLNGLVFFIAEQGDIMTRLEAVRAGAEGYFTKPVDAAALLEQLSERASHASARGYRALIVDDKPADAHAVAGILHGEGVVTQVESNPLRVIRALEEFQPDMLLLDLDLRTVNGLELAQAVRQHEAYNGLPMILLSARSDIKMHLSALKVGGDDLLSKRIIANEHLVSAVMHRMRRLHGVYARLNTLSHKDKLSGLYNRQYFMDRLERSVATLGISSDSVAVMLVLLENLRALRDATDMIVADTIVEQAARRLQGSMGTARLAARFGEAVFAILFDNADEEALLSTARSIREALEETPYAIGGHHVTLRTCIGVATAYDEKQHFLPLIQQADFACSRARQAEGKRIHIHNADTDQRAQEAHQRQLLHQIREAFDAERMALVFQPIASLRGDRVERYEVLFRLHDREGQELLPEIVFGATRQHRLGLALDRWVIERSIEVLGKRQSRARSTLLFVNVASTVLKNDAIAAWLKNKLEEYGARSDTLVFEIHEDLALQHLNKLRSFIDVVKALGCCLSLEHFRGNENSFKLLRTLPVDYVKLAVSHTRDLWNHQDKQQELGKLLEKLTAAGVAAVIASAIEDPRLLPLLYSRGIPYVQGFALQRPHRLMGYDFKGELF